MGPGLRFFFAHFSVNFRYSGSYPVFWVFFDPFLGRFLAKWDFHIDQNDVFFYFLLQILRNFWISPVNLKEFRLSPANLKEFGPSPVNLKEFDHFS
jgi:hypothetical protein